MPASPKATKKSGAPKAKGAVRAKSGCYTCRIRRKKCDEQPNTEGECSTCVRLHLECLGFGAKRPEWLRENRNVLELRERIKSFLAAQGMIKGTSGAGARNAEQEAPILRLSEGGYSSSSASPPTPVLSLSEELRPPILTLSSERDEPYPSTLNSHSYSHSGLHSTQELSPDSPYSAPRGALFQDDPMLSPYPTLPPLSHSNSIVSNLSPSAWHNNPTRYPQQSFPSPALTSTFGETYTQEITYEDEFDTSYATAVVQHTSVAPVIPPRIDVSFFGGQDMLVNHYMQKVLGIQYLLADPPAISTFILHSIHSSPSAYEAVCLLSALHRYCLQKADMSDTDIQQRYATVRQRLIGNHAPPSEGDAMAGLHVVSSFLFSGGTGPWQDFLQVPVQFSKAVLYDRHYNGPIDALMRCNEPERFIIKTSMWFDVLASISLLQQPFFMDEYRQVFGRSTAYIDGPISLASQPKELSMMSIMGCENHIVWALAEISFLAVWKKQEQRRGCLSMPELVDKGKDIENHLLPGGPVDSSTDNTHHFTSEIFRASSRVYLHSVISGDYPHCPEIKDAVQETVDILRRVPVLDPKVSRSVVRSVVFSIFICGCLTDDEEHRNYLVQRLSREQENESVGNCEGVKTLMETVWRQRTSRKTDPVRWRDALRDATMLLV